MQIKPEPGRRRCSDGYASLAIDLAVALGVGLSITLAISVTLGAREGSLPAALRILLPSTSKMGGE
jgi:hypothetical protein